MHTPSLLSTKTLSNLTLRIALFIVRIENCEVFRKKGITKRIQVGFADRLELEGSTKPSLLEMELPLGNIKE
jgi:hypothetical protein